MKEAAELEHERGLAAFNQNAETFRSLNSLMWQIPLIAMTLTGGLWFGVSKVNDHPWFQVGLLALAFFGNIGLILVLARLRFILGCYLVWLKDYAKEGHVAAEGTGFFTRSRTVRTIFQGLLAIAAFISGLLMLSTLHDMTDGAKSATSLGSVAYYDQYAAALADDYEGLTFERAHPRLAAALRPAPAMRVLDIGAGTGRDAAWMASAGHQVTAVEPSASMLRLARNLHSDRTVDWKSGTLPDLASLARDAQFDVILLSAVWMHVHPRDRARAMARLTQLLESEGFIYVTLRNGPTDPERAMFATPSDELRKLATAQGLAVEDLGKSDDLMGRSEIYWNTFVLRHEPGPGKAANEKTKALG